MPALGTTLAISAIIITFIGPAADLKRFAHQGIATLFLIGNFGAYRYSGNYFSPNPNPLIHTWSLSVEEQIYILLPVIYFLTFLFAKNLRMTALKVLAPLATCSFIIFLLPSICCRPYGIQGLQDFIGFSFYSPFHRLWQFLLGGFCSFKYKKLNFKQNSFPKYAKTLLVCLFLFFIFTPLILNLRLASILISSLTAVTLLTKSFDNVPKFLSRRLKWVGDRSYSIYLIHMPMLYLAQFCPLFATTNKIIRFAIALSATIILSSISHSHIESRFRLNSQSTKVNSRQPLVILVVFLILPLTLFLGINTISNIRIDSNEPVSNRLIPWQESKCRLFSEFGKINTMPCEHGDPSSTKSILLIGDSHAASDSTAVISLVKSIHAKLFIFTFADCSFILSTKGFNSQYSLPYMSHECLSHNQIIMTFVKKNKPDEIILAHRSSSLMVSPNNPKSRFQFNSLEKFSLEQLKKLNKNIVIIGSEPEYEPIASWFQKIMGIRGKFSSIPSEDNKFWVRAHVNNYYIDTLKIFCANNSCINRVDGRWLFYDNEHLSIEGTKMLLPSLKILTDKIFNSLN